VMIIIGIEYEYGYEVLFKVIKCGKVVSYISGFLKRIYCSCLLITFILLLSFRLFIINLF
jgi:hypothetical protein